MASTKLPRSLTAFGDQWIRLDNARPCGIALCITLRRLRKAYANITLWWLPRRGNTAFGLPRMNTPSRPLDASRWKLFQTINCARCETGINHKCPSFRGIYCYTSVLGFIIRFSSITPIFNLQSSILHRSHISATLAFSLFFIYLTR